MPEGTEAKRDNVCGQLDEIEVCLVACHTQLDKLLPRDDDTAKTVDENLPGVYPALERVAVKARGLLNRLQEV